MSQNLINLATTQFAANLQLKLQEKGNKLRSRVDTGSHVGKQASPINQEGPIKLRRPAGRFAPKVRTDSEYTRRWVFPIDGELDQLIDTFDMLKTIVDPKSPKLMNAANAVGRDQDDEIIAAATRTAYIGQDAASLTAETFDTSAFRIADDFGAAAATGLTVDKLIEAKRIFMHYENDLDTEELTLVIGSKQHSDLLKQVEVVSTEFNDRPVLTSGKLQQFLGFNIVQSERLPTYTTNTRGVLAFVKSGMYLGTWMEMKNSVSIRTDLSGEPYDLYTQVSFGATRTQPGKVLQIACLDTTGASITP